jgi:hypothetical protein
VQMIYQRCCDKKSSQTFEKSAYFRRNSKNSGDIAPPDCNIDCLTQTS